MEFSYKRALLTRVETWKLANGILTTPKGQQLDLRTVTGAQFSDMRVKRRWLSELQLKTPDTKIAINCNDTRNGGQRHQFFLLIFEVLRSLQKHNPQLKIQHGLGRITNYVYASAGLIPVGFGLSFLFEALQYSSGRSFGIGMGLFFLLLGAFWIWSASPWKAAPMRSPKELSDCLARVTGIQPQITSSSVNR